MTPNNIVNMARIKGLQLITVSDHNTARNTAVVEKLAAEAGVLFLPGIEMTSAEEVHVLAFFECAEAACQFGDRIYSALPDVSNNEAFFGRQLLMNERDEITGKLDKLLLTALPYSFSECCELAERAGGVVVPAHVNKGANSLLSNLGFFPPDCEFATIEVREECPMDGVLPGYRQVHSSDAHFLETMSEPVHELEVAQATIAAVLDALRGRSRNVQN